MFGWSVPAAVLGAVAAGIFAGSSLAVGAGRIEPQSVTIATVGDLLGYRKPLLQLADPEFAKVVKILQASDAGFLNLEGAIFDLNTFAGSHAGENGGGYPLDEPQVAPELANIGIKLISLANNHGTDWGVEGMLASEKVLEDAGLVHAGSGLSLGAARAPAYLKLPKATISLVAAASTYTPMSVAGAGADHLRPRPGISALRNQPIILVTSAEMNVLRAIAARRDTGTHQSTPNQVSLEAATFRLSDNTGMTYDVNPDDRSGIIEAARAGKANAQLLIFSIHAHETASADGDDERPADFLRPLFHDLIDAGADIVVRHGPHVLGGIEIYHGRPIFYGMGSFFFGVGGPSRKLTIDGNGTDAQRVEIQFPDSWYDSAIATTEFRRGRVKEIKIYPLTMHMEPGPLFGSPKIATGDDAARILKKLQADSDPYGTRIRVTGDLGDISGLD